PDPEVLAIIDAERQRAGIAPRPFSHEEIMRRYLAAMVNEAANVLREGIALRPLDIDVVFLSGYGFPRYRGGPMHYADQVGLARILADIREFAPQDPHFWQPSALLIELVDSGRDFASLNRACAGRPTSWVGPATMPPNRNTIMREAVIVSTARTPITKAHRGEFNLTPGPTLAAYAVRAAVDRAGIDPAMIEDAILGCGYPEGTTGRNIGRQAVIRAGLPVSVGGATVNRFCASGLQAIASAAARIVMDGASAMIAGGVESISHIRTRDDPNAGTDPWIL